MKKKISRRTVVRQLTVGAMAIGPLSQVPVFASDSTKTATLKGNINHSVCRWCYGELDLDTLCIEGKKLGLKAIDLAGPKDWPVLKRHGIDSSMCNGAEINLVDGWNDQKFHATLIKNYTDMIPKVAEAGYKNLICFSGNTRGKTDEEGWQNCVTGLKQVLPLAEKHGVILVMELLNSRVDHPDYQCHHTEWGVELAKRLGSENFKLLYDIYHMQVDEGDVIATIRKHHKYLGHYHTAGVPGRNEIDNTQELNYPAIMKAIVATGFKGYVAQEFIPKASDKLASLKQGIMICDV
ncbi:hydroxypyruvate isomerase family protein [Pedobacter sp. SYP-B3415]|uniref:hydroxypyruvate isomerase family protein n=1 Tax=Pedobacter sp. SYP-B3415 TaxID=2496641 RepID=UPI001981DB28|nr:TIM barrel protein [Pedobacter sp. SYP-B3415]